uniref:Uncharacterized protein n=1 Tax=Panagrolaimus sp. ES5 TaxID=591445 RepID=A0AC34G5J0_9BILA
KHFWSGDAEDRLNAHIGNSDLHPQKLQSKAKEIQRDFVHRGYAG